MAGGSWHRAGQHQPLHTHVAGLEQGEGLVRKEYFTTKNQRENSPEVCNSS